MRVISDRAALPATPLRGGQVLAGPATTGLPPWLPSLAPSGLKGARQSCHAPRGPRRALAAVSVVVTLPRQEGMPTE